MSGATTANGPVAKALQAQIDQNEQAQAVIDRDPEGAAKVLERAVTPDGNPITMSDMFGLFVQLQRQQAEMQQQMIQLLSGERTVQNQRERSQAHTQEELRLAQEQQRLTLESWKTEPRLPIFLEPDPDELKIASVTGEYPPRMHHVNGLEYPIRVGEVVNVPESIHAAITWAQNYVNKRRKPAQRVPTIEDPQPGKFLSSSQSVSPGRQGKVGEGILIASRGAATPEAAGPLTVEYDHEGN